MAAVGIIVIYIVATIGIGAAGLLFLVAPSLPQYFQDLLLYGKARGKRKDKSFVQTIEVPKKWFIHFYIVGLIANGFMIYVTVFAYILGQKPPTWLLTILKFVKTNNEVNTGAMSAIILVILMTLQNLRRLLECLFVSVYSSGTMNLAHYALGWFLYSTWGLVVLAEAPNITTYRVHDLHEELHNPLHVAGVLLFVFASFNHHKIHHIFGALRRDKQGKVKTYQHKIPTGSWFEWISSPHYFFEILIYISFALVSGLKHATVWSVVVFVIVNQITAALINHKWYKSEFKDFPKNRKAVIPFLL